MTAIPRSYKIFYGVICAAALLIGFLGYFAPARLAEITSWLTLPPLHAALCRRALFLWRGLHGGLYAGPPTCGSEIRDADDRDMDGSALRHFDLEPQLV